MLHYINDIRQKVHLFLEKELTHRECLKGITLVLVGCIAVVMRLSVVGGALLLRKNNMITFTQHTVHTHSKDIVSSPG